MQTFALLGWVFVGGGIGSALWQLGEAATTAAYVAGSVILSIAGLIAGMALMRGAIAP